MRKVIGVKAKDLLPEVPGTYTSVYAMSFNPYILTPSGSMLIKDHQHHRKNIMNTRGTSYLSVHDPYSFNNETQALLHFSSHVAWLVHL
jgi:hypothetical protein